MIVKDWIGNNENEFCFYKHSKIIVKMCMKFYHNCLKERHNAMHNPEMQKVVIQNKIIKHEEEVINGKIKEFDMHAEVHESDETNPIVN